MPFAKAAAAALDVMKLGQYELHYSLAKTESSPGFPKTVTPYQDNDFSKQDWPDGYKNIDPFESYRSLFDGDLAASDNKELIFTRGKNQGDRDLADMVRHQLPSIYGGWNTHGMKQKLCLVASLIHSPKVWVLDEPTVGLDIMAVEELKKMLREYANHNNTVFVTSHNIELVSKICDKVAIINDGKVVALYDLNKNPNKRLQLSKIFLDTYGG